MKSEEIQFESQLNYSELVNHLLQKYGNAKYDYFLDKSCHYKNKKVTRTSEGLLCHHIDEEIGGNLSDPSSAALQPFEYQRANRLVYCNYIEHLLLHIGIIKRNNIESGKPELGAFPGFTSLLGHNGIAWICRDLNELFLNGGSTLAWKQRCYEEVQNNSDEYIVILKDLLTYLLKITIVYNHDIPYYRPGRTIMKDNEFYVISRIDENDKSKIYVKKCLGKDSKEEEIKCEDNRVTGYQKGLSELLVLFSSTHDKSTLYNKTYISLKEHEKQITPILKEDYQNNPSKYIKWIVQSLYGSKTLSEYISKALPSKVRVDYDMFISGKPTFWKGNQIPSTYAKDSIYFFVRFHTRFKLKEGKEPFVEINNFIYSHSPKPLVTSDYYDKKTGKYYPKYYSEFGELKDTFVTLTMTMDDFEMFRENYNTIGLEILDGCYYLKDGSEEGWAPQFVTIE